MTAKTISNGLLRTIAILAGIVVLIWFFIQIQVVIIYVLIAGVLALISRPIIQFFIKKIKFKNTLAVVTTLAIYVVLISLFISAFTPIISKQSKNLALLNSDIFKDNIEAISHEINNYLLEKNIDLLEKTKNIDFLPSIKSIPDMLNIVLSKLGAFSMGLFSVFFITFFLMLDVKILSRTIYAFIPKKHIINAARSVEKIKDLLSRYFIGLVIQIGILFCIYAIILTVFDIESAIIIAFLCALFNLIPYIGPIIGGIVMFVFATTNNLNLDFQTEILPNSLYIMSGYLIAQLIDNFVSQPIIFSKSVKSHPLEIFLIILIFGNLFGILGMVISIPTFTAIKVVAKEFFNQSQAVKLLTKDL